MTHREHGVEELCAAGEEVYERALREGRIPVGEAAEVPCLTDFGLLHPALDDVGLLEPVAPAAALHRLLRASAARVAEERRREDRLVERFGQLLRIGVRQTPGTGTGPAMLRLLSGTEQINRAITDAMVDATEESLTIQPHSGLTGARGEAARDAAFLRDQALLDRGGRIRVLYQHTLRHVPLVYGPLEHFRHGDTEARSLDEVPDRLIVIDRKIAFLPANEDGTLALEVRHPALIKYFVTTFDRLWRLATPMFPKAVQPPSVNGVTPRQRAIAALLVEGHTDAVIADRLGMNIRTARLHIAKLAATLGSDSRAQLGYLIARSGILDQEP
ncbi:helix-turn-helix transcriptional regulator [Streptomyces sp. NPDC059680]|uniref:helix-turn-helix transcriptional regulator n=1 Tax=Streptomyces TaxID=1883 RepID=UPI001E46488F|nr:helix-turn-helix transcriptional regulator [Streptomyces barringtoniae]MCC5476996.1 helix-turn-helix transcriptional regulator [Streptomyces barringtoniae]